MQHTIPVNVDNKYTENCLTIELTLQLIKSLQEFTRFSTKDKPQQF